MKKANLKKEKKQEENKETEKEMWNRLTVLNKEFKDIREQKKKQTKRVKNNT